MMPARGVRGVGVRSAGLGRGHGPAGPDRHLGGRGPFRRGLALAEPRGPDGVLLFRRERLQARTRPDDLRVGAGFRPPVDRAEHHAVVRYDALSEMSGQLSFSVALLNAL